MNLIISHSQLIVLLEYERKPHDKKHEREYEMMKKSFLKFFDNIINSYFEDDSKISLYDKSEKRIMTYNKTSEELFFNRDLSDLIMELIPHHYWMRHGSYVIADVFNTYFDNPVKFVTPAGMN